MSFATGARPAEMLHSSTVRSHATIRVSTVSTSVPSRSNTTAAGAPTNVGTDWSACTSCLLPHDNNAPNEDQSSPAGENWAGATEQNEAGAEKPNDPGQPGETTHTRQRAGQSAIDGIRDKDGSCHQSEYRKPA